MDHALAATAARVSFSTTLRNMTSALTIRRTRQNKTMTMTNRCRVHCRYTNGNRITSPWYTNNDPRLAWFLRNIDLMTWLRIEREQ